MTSTEISPADRYRDLATTFTRRVDAVPANRWDSDSPCDGWTARDVLRHVIDTERDMVKVVGLELDAGPSVDDDPAAAWATVRDAMQRVLDDPATATLEYEGAFGRTDLAATVENFLCFDLVVHGWDVAKATGTDVTIPEADLEWARGVAESLGDSIRMPGVCGPQLPVPDDADRQTQVLAYLGRRG
ncbi:TIGR03086 family metal-binding protein [Nocardia sp. GCM10030253]|uniref:TIGR03086 family metal-binding protein n=1 Tax=Nocardia sp. GCM10030253 TaxID=3273404 RepID=UPI00363B45A6